MILDGRHVEDGEKQRWRCWHTRNEASVSKGALSGWMPVRTGLDKDADIRRGKWKELRRLNNQQLFKDKGQGHAKLVPKSRFSAFGHNSFYSHPCFDTSPTRSLPAGKRNDKIRPYYVIRLPILAGNLPSYGFIF